MQTISVNQLADKQSHAEVDLVDVRMPTEFREVHAECAHNVPLDSIDPAAVISQHALKVQGNGSADQPLYLICRSGNRSAQACKKFIDAGFENVVNVEGGTMAWDKAGLPIVRGKKSLPLMQQVQISAGFLTVFGVVLAYLVHPYFIGLSAFVGCGLMFAGMTGLCPMASMIAKMPWNQCGEGGCGVDGKTGSCSA